MIKGKQLPVGRQQKRLEAYLHVLRVNYNRAYRELSEIFRIRKGCPYEHSLRHRRFEQARELLDLADKCLKEINHCAALRLAAFRPGDQLLVKTTLRGFDENPRRYLLLDVEWRKQDEYVYIVHELTKSGTLHKARYPHWLWPSSRISIAYCDEPLPEETRRQSESRRRAAVDLIDEVLQRGDLSTFLPKPPPPQTPAPRRYPFWLR